MLRSIGISAILFVATSAFAFQQSPEEIRTHVTSKAFADSLGEVLRTVRVGTIPVSTDAKDPECRYALPALFVGVPPRRIQLPGSWSCTLSEFNYQCTWETKPNKYSVAVVQGELSTAVAAVVPKSWTRQSYDDTLTRFTKFIDPSGLIAITVQCPISSTSLVLSSYTVSLRIEPADSTLAFRHSAAK